MTKLLMVIRKMVKPAVARALFRVQVAALGILLAILGLDTPLAAAQATAARHENTNVILVSLQCLRPDHLGVNGYQRNTSPHMDQLARSSVLFDTAISQANLTPVSMMSVLTGQYPRINGMVAFDVAKESVRSRTLPEILKYYGYTTAAVSGSPEFFMRYDTEAGTQIQLGDVFSRSFDYFGRTRRGLGTSLRVLPTESLNWIQKNRDKKFFMWIASGVIHVPYAAGVPQAHKTIFDPPGYTPFWSRFPSIKADEGAADDTTYDVLMRIYRDQYFLGFKPVHSLTAQDRDYIVGRYDAAVRYTDLFIGQLVELLEKTGLSNNTLLIIHSIHGEDLGEKGTYVHYDLSEAAVRSALMMRLPRGEQGGRRVPQQVQGLDIVPTVLDYLGIPADQGMQGSSLLPLIRGEAGARGSDYAFIDRLPWWEHTLSRWYLEFKNSQVTYPAAEKEAIGQYGSLMRAAFPTGSYPPGDIAVRTTRWKLVLRKDPRLLEQVSWYRFITRQPLRYGEVELYDLQADPLEQKNVAAEFPQVAAELKKKLLEWDSSMERSKAGYGEGEKRYIIPYP